MKFLKYLAFSIASIAAVLGMIYLERETPVVRTVKATLGLEIAPLDTGVADKPGLFELARLYFNGKQDLPDVQALLAISSSTSKSADTYLPKALHGWMREDRTADAQPTNSAIYMPGTTSATAAYFREDMKLLISISKLPRRLAPGVATTMGHTKGDPDKYKDQTEFLDWRGEKVVVRRVVGTNERLVMVTADDLVVRLEGNVPTGIMKEYLQSIAMSGTAGGMVKPVPSRSKTPEFAHLVPAPLDGWSGDARLFTYDDILDFDAKFAPDGVRKRMERLDRQTLAGALDAGMRIEGMLLEQNDMQLLVTLTRLPAGRVNVDGFEMPGELVGSGLLVMTRTFETAMAKRIEAQGTGEGILIERSQDGTFAALSRVIEGAYLFQLRGNVPDDVIEAYLAALDWDAVAAAAKDWNPDWN